jgi:hypothetical protein
MRSASSAVNRAGREPAAGDGRQHGGQRGERAGDDRVGGQGKPATPTQAQWVSLRDTGELCSYTATQTASGGAWTVRWPQNVYGVSLIVLTP